MSPRPYRMGTRTSAVAQGRARVAAAARELFADRGFHRVSLDEVARRADVARATVYHQFGSKIGLLEAVVRDFEQRAGLEALAELVETAPPDRLIRAVVTAGCDYWATDPMLARQVIAFATTDAEAAHLLTRHDAGRLRLLSRMVDRLSAAGRLPDSCPTERALDTLWLLTGFVAYDELSRGRALSTPAAAELLADLAECRILGTPTARR